MILYRPVGLQEMALIYDSGMKSFPARLPQQPIFYPVLDLEYARQTASEWNAGSGQFAGYVTQFKVEEEYIRRFETHIVGESQHQELWIPAEEIEEFNRHITGHIKVVEAYFGEGFTGFVPEKFGLQGKDAVEQFTQLADTYLYKRMDFFLEIKRNHKAVFLNYPFWQSHDYKNPGLKEKILQAIKEAWFTSFPQIPLPLPPPIREELTHPEQRDANTQQWADDLEEEFTPEEETDPSSQEEEDHEDTAPVRESQWHSFVAPLYEENGPREQSDSYAEDMEDLEQEEEDQPSPGQSEPDSLLDSDEEEAAPARPPHTYSVREPIAEEISPRRPSSSHFVGRRVREESTLREQPNEHFVQGVQRGLAGNYQEAVDALLEAVEEDPDVVVAHTSLGVAFHRLGDDDRAQDCYETALKIDPIHAEAHYFRANILYSRGNVREAMAAYTVAIGLQPELIEAHQEPAPQDRLTDYTGAPAEMRRITKPAHRILHLNRLLEAHPRQPDLFKERAAEFYRLRNYAQAIADYSSALALQPNDASALHSRGVAYEQLGQSDHALEDYQRAIALDPQLWNFYINRGVAYGQMGNFRQSVASLSEGIRLAPGHPDGYFNRGMAYIQLGEFENAIADLSNVIRLSPKDEAAYYWRGMSNEEAGHRREAIADYRQVLSLSQDPRTRAEVEQKLSQWNAGQPGRTGNQAAAAADVRPKTNPPSPRKHAPELDLHALIVALGERALKSIWFGSGVECYGEKAEDLKAFTEHDRPIRGGQLRSITSGIHQTVAGDFQAHDPGADTPWVFIRAWEGTGFYIETDDPRVKKQLKAHFQLAEEVEGASPPYEGLFIRI